MVMIHGNLTCSLYYEPIMKKFSSHDIRCIAPCNRGFGYSSYNNPINSLEDLAKDIVLLIKEHLKLNKFYLFAHSLGSVIAIYLANLLKDQVQGIIMLSGFSIKAG